MSQTILDHHRPDLTHYEDIYKHLHSNPELSNQESETAAFIAEHLASLSPGLEIKTNIGGHGLVAICRNGPGKTLLLRADMDALPVEEKTGVEYASVKKMRDVEGEVKSVMHACGHDMHITCLLAATSSLLSARALWSGTLISLFQPAEERGTGASAMVSSGLYTAHAIPTPDVVLGQHVLPHPTGTVTTKPGAMMSAADSFQITIFGSGGHGSMPHRTVDPVVVTAHIVVRLQSVVSREVPPDETAVVTVGSIRGGETENVISDHAVLKVDVRSVSQEWRDRILEAVMRIVKAECVAGRCPREPLFERTREFPITFNDAETNEVVEEAFESYFGGQHRRAMKPELVSEDFSILATSIERPCVYWFFGGVEKEEWQRREREGTLDQIPVNHSAFFKPVLQPTLRTGVDALVVAALAFVGKKAEAGGVKRGGD